MTFLVLEQKLLEADGILKEQKFYTQLTQELYAWLKLQSIHLLVSCLLIII